MTEKLPNWYVYVLESRIKNYIYIGSTNNLERRLIEHNTGFVKSTKPYRPLEIIAYIAVKNERKARELEKYFKTGSGKAILKKRILSDYVQKTSLVYINLKFCNFVNFIKRSTLVRSMAEQFREYLINTVKYLF